MERALCYGCVDDSYLSKIIRDEGEMFECAVCEESEREAITVQRLGQIMEPILREHFELGPQVIKFGEDDKDWWEQDGGLISEAVQEVLGQYFDFEDEIVNAIVDADDYWPPDGDEAYWDKASLYVPRRVQTGHYFAEWHNTLAELKHGRRFFSPSARALFEKLFDGIDDLRARRGRKRLPVARVLPKGTSIYRARVCNSRAALKSMFANPINELGPPPAEATRPGRMNAEGVVVLYAARDAKTCLAEMRPALGSEVAIIEMKTTQALRVLDFARLDEARSGKALSYFQPDFTDQVERRAFLRRLHSLISHPIVPGREADYLITQTMAEYLAHVHDKPFDGILFSSVQRAGGVNIVLFPEKGLLTNEPADAFRVKYVDNTFRLVSTTAIRYSHHNLEVTIDGDGEPWVDDGLGPPPDDDWE
ncbi:MAG: RES family NAD+ phosphorylase [Aquabacterium sp.]|uniref:RES family NAD+ phosphorylase n=1 Tax=Aquabacterium sp. TaxID=1872578 RepID=UPI0027195549|nr:RES family NAD+ phosphorylase [Aquabacterium sp.]MDO9001851.1 RES family NAD+ phosphorylase [Aquabacterium sp.]